MAADIKAPEQAKFTTMVDGDAEDWRLLTERYEPFLADLPNRILTHLKLLSGEYSGFRVDRLEHSLQTATRAHRAGADEEYSVCALLHDIGDTIGPINHAAIAAAMLKPYVSEHNHWMVEHHAIFQGYYFFHYTDRDRNLREKFRGHPVFEQTANFCHRYDQNSFDPDYETMPIAAFEPMVRRVFQKVKWPIYEG